MKIMRSSTMLAFALGLILITLVGHCYGQLMVGFYEGKCKDANQTVHDVEQIIFEVVKNSTLKSAAAAMLRMHFHDCFVEGCDASILLNVTDSEKDAPPNETVRGYDLIDAAKEAVENVCPGVVSCADIIAIATRDTVNLAFGGSYCVETGRRDGNTSIGANAIKSLPAPDIPVLDAIALFDSNNLTLSDFVLLLGGHTVGIAHCDNFYDRLYNYNGVKGASDPSIDKKFLTKLKRTCPQSGTTNNFMPLDQVSPTIVDNGYYKSIDVHQGVLQIDNDIAFKNNKTQSLVEYYAANNTAFKIDFGIALVHLGRVGVLTGTQGEIRQTCSSVNY